MSMQSFVLDLSDALDADACAPVQSIALATFWSVLEMGIRSRGRVEQNRIKKIYSAPPAALPNGFCAGLCPSRRARSFEVSGRKIEKLEIRVSQHAPIFPLTMFSRGLIFSEIHRFRDLGDF